MRDLVLVCDENFYMRLLLFVLGVAIIVPAFNAIASSAFSREEKNYFVCLKIVSNNIIGQENV